MLTPAELEKLSNITIEQFYDAYDDHLPNGWIKFAYKYFSLTSASSGFKLRRTIELILIALPILGLLGTMFNLNDKIVKTIAIIYSALLSLLVIYLFSIVIMNNIRINKIRKKLDVTREQYNYLANKYYTE